jgi:hypothetical protein
MPNRLAHETFFLSDSHSFTISLPFTSPRRFINRAMAKRTAAALAGMVKGGRTAPKVKAARKKKATPKAVKSSKAPPQAQPTYSYASGVTVSEAYCLEPVDGKLASVKVLADGTRQVMKKGEW